MNKLRRNQSGMALIVGLVMLVMMTLVAVLSFNMGRTSLDIVGNMQVNQQMLVSANATIEEALSTTRMFESPETVFLDPCTNQNTRCYDVNDDDEEDITVTLTPVPRCVSAQNIQSRSLNLSLPDDQACAISITAPPGIRGAMSGDSLCAESVWEIVAQAQDAVTDSSTVVVAGAAVRVSKDSVETSCPSS